MDLRRYSFLVGFDENIEMFVASCAEIPDLRGEGSSEEEAISQLKIQIRQVLIEIYNKQ